MPDRALSTQSERIGPWVCNDCGRTFTSEEEGIGHLDKRPRDDGYHFCSGFVRHEDAPADA